MKNPLLEITKSYRLKNSSGITSVCSAHPLVIKATLEFGLETKKSVLIEATCNQVNQDGGYTGMTPADFVYFVHDIAKSVGFDLDQLILGGDHLGPNPWKHLAADEAMKKAEVMIAEFVRAGFSKLHLDTSMGCMDEPDSLQDWETARRAARLAIVAETNKWKIDPVYIIGTEVPVPGGAQHAIDKIAITTPEAVHMTYDIHKNAFENAGLQDAFSRVIALVVQPGVEFGNENIIQFNSEKALTLSNCLKGYKNLVFEAHSTDYQSVQNLTELARMGFSILKVGPWLTFALREVLYILDNIADILDGKLPQNGLMELMEKEMLADPTQWKKHYSGSEQKLWWQRHFSLSDRIRYYWPAEKPKKAVAELLARLGNDPIPFPILHQFFPNYPLNSDSVNAQMIIENSIKNVLRLYDKATSS
jgi:D-tagatose-1,6-bisphosphate aldolase subunit GatZ/KbaZ